MERVKSSDVLDPTHEVTKAFSAMLLGTFRRVGPNAWDDYEFVRSAGSMGQTNPGPSYDPRSAAPDPLEVGALLPVQLEPRGCEVRYRASGKVQRVRFLPTPDDLARLAEELGEPFEPRAHAQAIRKFFERSHLRQLGQGSTLGAAAVIVDKLVEK